MGGGLSSYLAAILGKKAYTFNAAGVHQNTLEVAGVTATNFDNITNYTTRGDILTEVQVLTPLPNALGQTIYHGSGLTKLFLTGTEDLLYRVESHKSKNIYNH